MNFDFTLKKVIENIKKRQISGLNFNFSDDFLLCKSLLFLTRCTIQKKLAFSPNNKKFIEWSRECVKITHNVS